VVLLAISCILFVTSLFNEGYSDDRGGRPAPALLLFLIGWLGVFLGFIAWLANPLLLMGWILLAVRRRRSAAACAFAAAVCAGSFLFCKPIVSDDAGHRSRITGYGLGYWLWLASAAVLLAASLVDVIGPANPSAAKHP